MSEEKTKVYGYRWVVLMSFVLIALMTQVLWISFAPITSAAARFYHTSDLMIGLLSMSFMVVYILIFLPSAWAIDTWGFRKAVGLGAVLTAVFALTRGLFAANLTVVFLSQIGIAFGQPLILGSITKLAARWFAPKERATASGLGTLSLYLGPLLAMLLTPHFVLSLGLPRTLLIYGLATVVAAAVFLVLAREHPPTPAGKDERVLMLDGLKAMLRQRDFLFLLAIFFVGLGLFNCVSTWVEDIIRPRGFSITQAGLLGGLMLVGGIVGAIIVPLVSDTIRRRKPFVVLALAGLLPGLIGVTFAKGPTALFVSGFALGFFLLSAGPIGFQYAAELTHPAPEGTSNTLLLVSGQVSGIVFILLMDSLRSPATKAMTGSLLGLAGMVVIVLALSTLMRESPIHKAAPGRS
jgi:cyanate permease